MNWSMEGIDVEVSYYLLLILGAVSVCVRFCTCLWFCCWFGLVFVCEMECALSQVICIVAHFLGA